MWDDVFNQNPKAPSSNPTDDPVPLDVTSLPGSQCASAQTRQVTAIDEQMRSVRVPPKVNIGPTK